MQRGGFQPYARGQERLQGSTLQAMVAGESSLGNPQDVKRQVQKQGTGTGAGTELKTAPIRSQVLEEFAAKYGRPSD